MPRRKGSLNKRTLEKLAIAEAARDKGETPLEYMTRVYRDRTVDHARRDDMAKAAAPYIHPRLVSTEANVKSQVQVTRIEELIVDPVVASVSLDDADKTAH
jgi:hypothetical protein